MYGYPLAGGSLDSRNEPSAAVPAAAGLAAAAEERIPGACILAGDADYAAFVAAVAVDHTQHRIAGMLGEAAQTMFAWPVATAAPSSHSSQTSFDSVEATSAPVLVHTGSGCMLAAKRCWLAVGGLYSRRMTADVPAVMLELDTAPGSCFADTLVLGRSGTAVQAFALLASALATEFLPLTCAP